MAASPKAILTIDTEGDNMWSRPHRITTENARFLPRFQSLCERFGFLPTYLTNYEMAVCPVFQEFAQDMLRRGTGEIGMHLHAWNSPPIAPLTSDDYAHQPYLIEYPPEVMREKIARMTGLLSETFATPITSHRAGRWAMNADYSRFLREFGYVVDCSVTPGVSWADNLGTPEGRGGTDYSNFPRSAYFMSDHDLAQPAASGLLQVPMTIAVPGPAFLVPMRQGPAGKLLRRIYPQCWLRPNGTNLNAMLQLVREAPARPGDYLEFMLHSSELMPGGSPTFPSEASVEKLYEHLESLFAGMAERFRGATLSQYARQVLS